MILADDPLRGSSVKAAYGTFDLTKDADVTIDCGFSPSYIMCVHTGRALVSVYLNGDIYYGAAGAFTSLQTSAHTQCIGRTTNTGFIFTHSQDNTYAGTYYYAAVE